MTTLKERFRKWCQMTTCHGIIDWFESPSVLGKVFWFLLFLTSLGVATWQVYELTVSFASEPHYQTTTSSMDHGAATFPYITLCNFNRADRDRAMALGMTMANDSSKLDPDYLNYLYMSVPTDYPVGLYLDVIFTSYEATLEKVATLKLKFETWRKQQNLSHISLKQLVQNLGLACKDMVIQCMWAGEIYECCESAEPIVTNYGLCWSLRLKTNVIETTGSKTALTLRMLPRTDKYTPEVAESSYLQEGLILGVNFNPFDYRIASPLIVLRSGTSTSISLKNLLNSHVKPKYEIFKMNCIDNPKLLILKGNYSRNYCVRDRIFHHFNSACGCVPLAETLEKDVAFCDGMKMMRCITPTSDALGKSHKFAEYAKHCLDPCEPELSVETIVATSTFPGPLHLDGMVKRFSDLKEKAVSAREKQMLTMFQNLSSEWITADIYFSSLSLLETIKFEKVPVITFIGSVGGQLGLWLGMSIMTVVQFIYYWIPGTVSKKES